MLYEIMYYTFVLQKWKANPQLPIKDYGLNPSNSWIKRPYSVEEIERMKSFLRKHAFSSYRRLFPEEVQGESADDAS